jgi:peptidoglycan/xylan/chitin deacetylase (PgdA/CDA1 family)
MHRVLTRNKAPGLVITALALGAASLSLAPAASFATPHRVSAAAAPVASVLPNRVRKHHPLPAKCRAGLVALTFDDGPSSTVTPRLVKILTKRKVEATFFMVGSRIHTAPAAARLVQRSGFTIGNHTYTHAQLTHLSDARIRHQLRSTRREMREHGVTPSNLMRPPYGDISRRVRIDIRGLGLVPVLWTIDSRDWAGGTSQQIADRILGALRRHGTNVVLQHDGVTNSPNSVGAVPIVVRKARERGFCFTHIGPHGGPAVPVVAPKPPPANTQADAQKGTQTAAPARTQSPGPTTLWPPQQLFINFVGLK